VKEWCRDREENRTEDGAGGSRRLDGGLDRVGAGRADGHRQRVEAIGNRAVTLAELAKWAGKNGATH
jgi:hypothetical protein